MLRSRSNFDGSGSDPSNILRLRLRLLLLAPAPGHFQKPINQKFKVMIFFIKNEKKWMIVLRGQNKNLKETWIRYHILKNLLVMEVFLLDNYRSRSRKRIFFSAPAPAKNYGSGRLRLRLRNTGIYVLPNKECDGVDVEKEDSSCTVKTKTSENRHTLQ